jgi:hypothetical protein
MLRTLTIVFAVALSFTAIAQETPGKDQSPSTTGGRSTSVNELPGKDGDKEEPASASGQNKSKQDITPAPAPSSKSGDEEQK